MFIDKLSYFMLYKSSDKLKFNSIIAVILGLVAFLSSVLIENSLVILVAFPLSFIMNVVFIFNFIKEYRNYLKEDN